jgi:hypothetical protein
MKAAMANFDCDDIYREHAFLVRLTKGREAKALVFEVFGRPPSDAHAQLAAPAAWAPETILRCEASRDVWDAAAPEARAEFDRRLRIEGKPVGRWATDDTAVQRLFGKELLVLLWAIEQSDVSPEEIAVGIRNWLGLKPEERWWLYTMTAAATGPRPSGRHGLAGCAAAGAMLRHQTRCVPSGCGRWARLARTALVC